MKNKIFENGQIVQQRDEWMSANRIHPGVVLPPRHLRTFGQRYAEILQASILEVLVFHSQQQELHLHAKEFPSHVIADPDRRLYKEFGVEAGPRAMLDPRAWRAILEGVGRSLLAIARTREAFPAVNPSGGRFGLPADFLVANDGIVLACKYGAHVYDQWSVDEVLALARESAAYPRSLDILEAQKAIQNYGTRQ